MLDEMRESGGGVAVKCVKSESSSVLCSLLRLLLFCQGSRL